MEFWHSASNEAVLYLGDCIEEMQIMPDASIDAIVTDPPYGLSDHRAADVVECLIAWLKGDEYQPSSKGGFMGKTWDSWVPSPSIWREAYRVLKPGGHIAAFAGARTHDLMSIAMRLAGFECRDTVAWVFGSGFPKSMNVSRAISDSGASEAAKPWQGFGTALKPAFEPILLFRKPLAGTVAANILEHGTGAMNIDGCRIAASDGRDRSRPPRTSNSIYGNGNGTNLTPSQHHHLGRWPANIIHDGSDEALACFPETGVSSGGRKVNISRTSQIYGGGRGLGQDMSPEEAMGDPGYGDEGSAARFFYCAKASQEDRHEGLDDFVAKVKDTEYRQPTGDPLVDRLHGCGIPRKNNHPTVKPASLMRWLCRLIAPPKGVILDPFMGSGSTGKAAVLEGFKFIGVEQEEEYAKIAKARVSHAIAQIDSSLMGLFR